MKMPEYVAVKIMPDKKGTSYNLEVVTDADFVNVVRCKNCRYWNKDTITHNENDFRKWNSADCDLFQYRDGYHDCDWSTEEDDFCSYGEKVTE